MPLVCVHCTGHAKYRINRIPASQIPIHVCEWDLTRTLHGILKLEPTERFTVELINKES